MKRSFFTDPPQPLNKRKKPNRRPPNRVPDGAPIFTPKGQKDVKRRGAPTGVERELVERFVKDQTGPVSKAQVKALAALTRRTTRTVKKLVEDARLKFIGKAERYVEIHAQAVEDALSSGDVEQAIKGSQWAIANLAAEGVRIIDKPNSEPSGTKVMIGVQIGGITDGKVLVKQIAPSTPEPPIDPLPIDDEAERM